VTLAPTPSTVNAVSVGAGIPPPALVVIPTKVGIQEKTLNLIRAWRELSCENLVTISWFQRLTRDVIYSLLSP
jgi:hypothetical protein